MPNCWEETKGKLGVIDEILPRSRAEWQRFVVSINVGKYDPVNPQDEDGEKARKAAKAIKKNKSLCIHDAATPESEGGLPIWYRKISKNGNAHAALIVPAEAEDPANASTFSQKSKIYARIKASENFDLVVFCSNGTPDLRRDRAGNIIFPIPTGRRSVGFGEFWAYMAAGSKKGTCTVDEVSHMITLNVFSQANNQSPLDLL